MKLFKKKTFWIIAISIALVVIGIVSSGGNEVPEFSSQVVERIDLKQTVSETGSVEAELELMYGWEVGGKVAEIYKEVGNIVTSSDVIAVLANGQQQARYNEAAALYSSANARLNLEIAGASDESKQKAFAVVDQAKAALLQSKANLSKVNAQSATSVSTAEKAVETAKNNLQFVKNGDDSELVNDAYADLVNKLKSSITSFGSALTESDNILGVDNTQANDEFESVLSVIDSGALATAKNSYILAKNGKSSAESLVFSISFLSNHADIDVAATVVQNELATMQNHLFHVQQVLAATRALGDLSQAELDTLKSGITTVQGTIDTSATNVTNAVQDIASARISVTTYTIAYSKALLDLEQTKKQTMADVAVAEAQIAAQEANVAQAEASYNDLVAPPRNVDVASFRADVARQAANLSALRDELEKTKLVALASGVISKLDVEVGENVSANQEVVGILSEGLTIKVDISESDIAKIQHEDVAMITLDAYGDDVVFEGYVFSIEPAETEISGVVYYNTTIVFDKLGDEYDVRSGMTANVDILTDVRESVLVIPRRAVFTQDGSSYVRVLKDIAQGSFEEREVTMGLIGDDGVVEVLTGLEEGDKIVTFLKE